MCLFTAEFSQLSIFTADCLRHPIQMAGVETVWELHTLIVINSWWSSTQIIDEADIETMCSSFEV